MANDDWLRTLIITEPRGYPCKLEVFGRGVCCSFLPIFRIYQWVNISKFIRKGKLISLLRRTHARTHARTYTLSSSLCAFLSLSLNHSLYSALQRSKCGRDLSTDSSVPRSCLLVRDWRKQFRVPRNVWPQHDLRCDCIVGERDGT